MPSADQLRLAVELCERVASLLDVPFEFAVEATNAVSQAMNETDYLVRMMALDDVVKG